jgi:hypothetical protein
LGIGNPHARIIIRPWPPNRVAGRVTATNDRLTAIVRLIQHCGISASSDGRCYTKASVINDVGTRRARRQDSPNHASILVDPMLCRMKAGFLAKVTAGTAHSDVVGDQD